ncbi:MAG: DUF4954 family protein [Spirochaetes bacterium]|nr:DUF4954 family protein [Spirochaetota bacterium]
MSEVKKNTIGEMTLNFIPQEFAPKNEDPFLNRNKTQKEVECRNLAASEIEVLVKNNNFAEDWNEIFVTDEFDPNLVKNCEFFGKITIGKLTSVYLEYHDLRLPVGISNSTIISCNIGDNVVIRDVHYLSHYIINNQCILFNIDEMITTNHAKFGNGIIKEGEDESVRVWLEVSNENEGRKVLPFESMLPSDAFIWSKFRDDKKLMKKLKEITDESIDNKRGYYGIIGANTIIKNSRIIKDVKVGEYAYIKGTNKLKNITILSSKEESSQIGEGVELVNGIVGYGSKIFYGSKAIRFITGRNTQLKYGARLINSFLGDNSTVSCCELLNNLIFPFHEQHHNNSFLIATTVLGQSNIAAGATIGSNHNSRAPDGEIFAGRGFWPGLCTNFKHNCRFASFVLIAKGSYQNEMNIKYPFSLVSMDKQEMAISIMPAYWFMHNMYAVARNTYKFKKRDKRKVKIQNIEFDYLAPDTVSEILFTINRIEYLIGLNLLQSEGKKSIKEQEAVESAREYLSKENKKEITLHDPESMKKYGAAIIKPIEALKAYKEMCIYFAVKNIFVFFNLNDKSQLNELINEIKKLYNTELHIKWWNIGGQIIPDLELKNLINDIKNNKLKDWESIHKRYDSVWAKYAGQKTRYSLYVLEQITEKKIHSITCEDWKSIFKQGINIAEKILDLSLSSREKDYNDPYRLINYCNNEEMKAVIGNIDENSFLNELKNQTKEFVNKLKRLL